MNLVELGVLMRTVVLPIAFIVSLLSSGLGGLSAANAGELTAKNGGPNRVTSLRAFLYYQEKGKFSHEDLLSGRLALRNVIGGGGDAEGPSGAMLVLVGVMHSSFGHKSLPSTLVRLTVKAGDKALTTQEIALRSFWSEQQTIEFPFLIYGTGCERLEIIATLVEQNRIISSLSKTAEFTCGE